MQQVKENTHGKLWANECIFVHYQIYNQHTHTHTLTLARNRPSFSLIVISHSAESVLEPTHILVRKYKHESICLLWTEFNQQSHSHSLFIFPEIILIYTFFYSKTDFNWTETEFTPEFISSKCSSSPLLTKTTGNNNKNKIKLRKCCKNITTPAPVQCHLCVTDSTIHGSKRSEEQYHQDKNMYRTLKFLSRIYSTYILYLHFSDWD